MGIINDMGQSMLENWPVWVVTITLILAAVIDGFELKVPNWVTFPFVISGWIYSGVAFGWEGLGWSLMGTIVGLALLLPLYSIGGMGAGDVKLLAGVGAWMHGTHTFYGFCISAVAGAICAMIMVGYHNGWTKHTSQARVILNEILTIKDPNQLAAIAAERKPSMLLLPYGIPIAIGTIGYFVWMGLLL
ncbi:MAG: A24 family peptidase [Pirellulales bacterium]